MVTISNIYFGFGQQPLFSDLNLDLLSGQIYGLLGKNAEGKTTLLKMIAGLRFPDKGAVQVMGAEPGKRDPNFLQKVFFVPEDFELPRTSVEQYHQEISSYYPSFQHETFDRCIGMMEIRASNQIGHLSFGQQKKVLLAVALASGCPLVIMDEPTNGLDIPSKVQFRKLLPMVMTDETTFILATHQIRELEQLIDPVIILHQGDIAVHQDLATISEHLSFSVQAQEPASSDVVYSERTLGGYAVIRQPGVPDESPPDLELLFSAVVNDPNKFKAIFGRKEAGSHE